MLEEGSNKLSLFNAHVLITYVSVYMNLNKLCSNLTDEENRFFLLGSSGVGKAWECIF